MIGNLFSEPRTCIASLLSICTAFDVKGAALSCRLPLELLEVYTIERKPIGFRTSCAACTTVGHSTINQNSVKNLSESHAKLILKPFPAHHTDHPNLKVMSVLLEF